MPVSILVVDDHVVFRKGVCALLRTYSDFQIVGEVGDGKEALDMTARLRPEVVLLDFVLPGMNGAAVSRLLLERQPDLAVIIMSMYDDETYFNNAMRSGIRSYLLKEDLGSHLAQAILAVKRGGTYFSPNLRGLA